MMIKKDFLELTWNVSEQEYRKSSAISYSLLSSYSKRGFKAVKEYLEGVKISSGALRHGSAVDTLLTSPEVFDDLYIVANYSRPTDLIRSIVDALWKKALDNDINGTIETFYSSYPEAFMQIIDSFNYGGENWKAETKAKKIIDSGGEYYNLLTLTKDGKELIHQDDYTLALGCVKEIKDNKYTSWLFKETDHTKIYFQSKFKINFGLKNELLVSNKYSDPLIWKDSLLEEDTIRCMLDIVFVDYNKKVIIPIDLKTTSSPEEDFENSFYDWKYYLQSSMYSYILRQICASDEYFKDFKVLPFRFLPINKFNLAPQFFVDDSSVEDIQPDFVDYKNNNCEPWYKLLTKVRWHISTNNFKYNMNTVLSLGINHINAFKY